MSLAENLPSILEFNSYSPAFVKSPQFVIPRGVNHLIPAHFSHDVISVHALQKRRTNYYRSGYLVWVSEMHK